MEIYVYSGYGIRFDSAGEWSFDNDTARNVIIFGVDNSSSSLSEIRKNNFSVIGEGLTFGIRCNLVLILLKQTENFAWVYIIMLIIVICFLMEKKA